METTSNSGHVKGTVHRSDGTPSKAITVTLFDAAGKPLLQTTSDQEGVFAFERVPAGSYTILASEPGFQSPGRIPVRVIRNSSANVNIKMQRRSCCSKRK